MTLPLRVLLMIFCSAALIILSGCQWRTAGGGSPPTYSKETITHVVQVGETITMVATRYAVSVRTIIDANNLYSRLLKPGTKLYIPGGRQPEPDPFAVTTPVPKAPDAPPINNSWYVPRTSWTRTPVVVSRTDPMGGKPSRITVHHSGNAADVGFNSREWLQRIDLNHIKGVGHSEPWACIGYHYIIDASGNVFEGRPIQYQGAHAGNSEFNKLNIGVCLIGDFNKQRVPAAQQRVMLEVLDRLCLQYGINRSAVYGHKHFKITDCPGRNLEAIINAFSQRETPAEDPDLRQAALPNGATRMQQYFSTQR